MGERERTEASHAFVVVGTLEASDEILDLIQDHDDAELVYHKHSADNLYISEEKPE